MRLWHFLKSTGNMGPPPSFLSRAPLRTAASAGTIHCKTLPDFFGGEQHFCQRNCDAYTWCIPSRDIRDLSLITRREGGGLQNGRGGASEVLPLQKGGIEKVLAMLNGEYNKFLGNFNMGA